MGMGAWLQPGKSRLSILCREQSRVADLGQETPSLCCYNEPNRQKVQF